MAAQSRQYGHVHDAQVLQNDTGKHILELLDVSIVLTFGCGKLSEVIQESQVIHTYIFVSENQGLGRQDAHGGGYQEHPRNLTKLSKGAELKKTIF